MENESGGEVGGSGLQDLGKLLKKTREKYKTLHPNDPRWPCPFCLHKAKTLVQCKIHLNKDHKMLTMDNVRDALTESQPKSAEESSQNFTNDDLKRFLELIENDQNTTSQSSINQTSKCSRCGFQAKNSRGLNIHMNSCNKKNVSNCTNSEIIDPQETLIDSLSKSTKNYEKNTKRRKENSL